MGSTGLAGLAAGSVLGNSPIDSRKTRCATSFGSLEPAMPQACQSSGPSQHQECINFKLTHYPKACSTMRAGTGAGRFPSKVARERARREFGSRARVSGIFEMHGKFRGSKASGATSVTAVTACSCPRRVLDSRPLRWYRGHWELARIAVCLSLWGAPAAVDAILRRWMRSCHGGCALAAAGCGADARRNCAVHEPCMKRRRVRHIGCVLSRLSGVARPEQGLLAYVPARRASSVDPNVALRSE